MLRKIRVTIAVIFFVLITLLFLDYSGISHQWLGWLAKIQFLPAILALNAGVLLFLILLTLLFGRVYCSVICPLGVYQDLISWIASRRKKNRFFYSPALSSLRYALLGFAIIAIAGGISLIVSLLDPYAAYGRIATAFFNPVYRWVNNLLVLLAERMDSYLIYSVEVWLPGLVTLVIAMVTWAVVTALAWKNGRSYCNTVCPVGTLLGLISRFSVFKTVFNAEKCNKCGLCARNCKASCINAKAQTIDYSRCVACMNCLEKCKRDAIKFTSRRKVKSAPEIKEQIIVEPIIAENKNSRRQFITATSLLAISSFVKAQQVEIHGDGGLAEIIDKKAPDRQTPILPPGSVSARNMRRHCTACQLCVSACPDQILRPSTKPETFMQPQINYERGYCRPECTRCSEVCPTGAINRLTTADKSATQIGRAVWFKDKCVVNTDDVTCRNCERHCPTNAIMLVPRDPDDEKSLKIPTIDNERCIGCGACENLCPARPHSAIYIEGNERQRIV